MDSLEIHLDFSQWQGIWFTNHCRVSQYSSYAKRPLISCYISQGAPFTEKCHNKQTPGFQYELSPPTKEPTTAPSARSCGKCQPHKNLSRPGRHAFMPLTRTRPQNNLSHSSVCTTMDLVCSSARNKGLLWVFIQQIFHCQLCARLCDRC